MSVNVAASTVPAAVPTLVVAVVIVVGALRIALDKLRRAASDILGDWVENQRTVDEGYMEALAKLLPAELIPSKFYSILDGEPSIPSGG